MLSMPASIFPLDPPGAVPALSGTIHNMAGLSFLLAIPAVLLVEFSENVLTRSTGAGKATYWLAPLVPVSAILLFAFNGPFSSFDVGGLIQRLYWLADAITSTPAAEARCWTPLHIKTLCNGWRAMMPKMPKPLKKPSRKSKSPAKPKPPNDPNRAAHAILAEHLAQLQDETTPLSPLDFNAQYEAHMAKLGEKGGKASGAQRMENPTKDKRGEIASRAARNRSEDVARQKAAKKR